MHRSVDCKVVVEVITVISIWGLFEILASVGIYLFIGVFICLLSSSCFLRTLVVVHFFLCSATSLGMSLTFVWDATRWKNLFQVRTGVHWPSRQHLVSLSKFMLPICWLFLVSLTDDMFVLTPQLLMIKKAHPSECLWSFLFVEDYPGQ